MKKIMIFDTSVASLNKGDEIIMQSCKKQLAFLLKDQFTVSMPTHTPMSHFYQNGYRFGVGHYFSGYDYKFVCGTNLINANLFVPVPLWNVNLFNCRFVHNVICLGVGMGSNRSKPNFYTKMLYRRILSKEYIHSTRDERTAEFLRSMGFRAINTGCATTWELTNEHCAEIPQTKAESVIFTLTDYKQDIENDRKMIEVLKKNYKEVYFWVQGFKDLEYLKTLVDCNGIHIVEPSVAAYEKVLEGRVDFVGTRLHAGIKAMQKKCRTIIIAVDNRAVDMRKDIDLVTLKRSDIDQLETLINKAFITKPNIKSQNMKTWLAQFK